MIRAFLLAVSWTIVSVCVSAQEQPTTIALRLDATNPSQPAVYAGDVLISQYVPQSNTKPIFYPLRTLAGAELTRRGPVESPLSIEKQDHPHHRSFWFTYGDLNGLDFWSEEAKERQGYIRSQRVQAHQSGTAIDIATEWNWVDGSDKLIATSKQTFSFEQQNKNIFIDCKIQLIASEQDLQFGDTKEGAFGVRVGGAMKVDAKRGGSIMNAEGNTDDDAWGKRSSWVDYSGPAVAGLVTADGNGTAVEPETQPAGIAILVHPSTFGYPGRWHVRTYGLFTHNPFGVRDYLDGEPLHETEASRQGGFKLPKGESVQLRYLVVLHDQPLASKDVNEIWKDFANR